MSDQILAIVVIVVAFAVSVWAVALASQAVDLTVLPVRRRHRVEWCRGHDRQVLLIGAVLVTVLALYELVTA